MGIIIYLKKKLVKEKYEEETFRKQAISGLGTNPSREPGILDWI